MIWADENATSCLGSAIGRQQYEYEWRGDELLWEVTLSVRGVPTPTWCSLKGQDFSVGLYLCHHLCGNHCPHAGPMTLTWLLQALQQPGHQPLPTWRHLDGFYFITVGIKAAVDTGWCLFVPRVKGIPGTGTHIWPARHQLSSGLLDGSPKWPPWFTFSAAGSKKGLPFPTALTHPWSSGFFLLTMTRLMETFAFSKTTLLKYDWHTKSWMYLMYTTWWVWR